MKLLRILYLFLSAFVLLACEHEKPQCVDPWATAGVDSVSFRKEHHFWKNYNFVATDSIPLESLIPGELTSILTMDSATILSSDEIVVANVAIVPEDSIDSVWVMVARDQVTMGWVHESELLQKTIPDNFTSRFIAHFSDSRMIVLLCCLSLGFMVFIFQRFRKERFLMVHFNDIRSFYPTLMCICMSFSATVYGTIQRDYPEIWREFYFHPTFNPFGQPAVIMLFLFTVWLLLVVLIAVIEDLRKQPKIVNAVSYMISLSGVCMVLYLFFSISVQYYVGYPILAAYWVFALKKHGKNNSTPYLCGNCGKPLHSLGKCPHCGAINEE